MTHKYKEGFIKTILCLSFFLILSAQAYASATIETLKTELDSNPDDLKMRQSLAQAYFDKGESELAINVLKVKAEQLNQESLALLALSYKKINDPTNELKFLEQLTVNYPKHTNGFVLLGDYYLKKYSEKNDTKQYLNSVAAYKNALEINSSFRPAYDGLIVAYEKYNNFYELRILLGDMLKKFGKSSKIISSLCRRYTIDGYFVNARKLCNEAISIDNKNVENYIYLSLIENNEGQIEKADAILKRASSDFPQSEFASSNYADFLIQQKNLPGAESYYQKATKNDPKSFRANIGLALVGFELKHYESALSAYKNACKTNPHQTIKFLKRSSDLLRHRKENSLEDSYTHAISKCSINKESDRSPASIVALKEEYRSAFALYSKNKNINLGH